MKFSFSKLSVSTFAAGIASGIFATVAVGQSSLGSALFPDVPTDAYYNEAVGEMASLGIITGFADGTFKPNDPLTRGQAAVLMKRIRDEIKGIRSSSSSSSTRSSSSSSSSVSSSNSSSSSDSSIPSAGLIRFTTTQYKVDEDDDTVTITLVRAGGNRGQVEVEYKLVAGTATAGSDYEVQEGKAVFDSGSTSTKFDITILDDDAVEGDESFTITLSNPTGGAGFTTPNEAEVLIDDDETADTDTTGGTTTTTGPEQGTFAYSAEKYSILENEGTATIKVIRKDGSKGSVAVEYSMTNGTANSSFYTQTSGTLSFSDGETEKTFTVTILDNDNEIDGNKTIFLTLSNPTNGAVLHEQERTSTLTIHDEDIGTYGSGSLKLSDSEYEGLESDGSVRITVRRIGGAKGVATVKYKTIGGTATAGTDYTAVDSVLTFNHGEASKTFIIYLKKDTASDGGESVNVRIQDAVNASIVSPSQSTLYIY